ncbi:isochorismatase family protein [Deinococcus hopiensis]|uniref:Nicotinamidase-related amidase n=1 Tax=Deinococcus hopiensis KR-140 TaxID=695939 RepID=A0A1W1VGV9_9DEIO|nr:isochorismatase family protein [Deinococcus hopiensis]SMB92546.1 Nicotinamidase-related amidase [Deinococcus hopiensis KR-140]
MPITSLDSQTALVLIDLQVGVLRMPTAHPSAEVLRNAVRLAEAFRHSGRPVVLVHVAFAPDGGDTLRPRADAPRIPSALPADFADFPAELGPESGDIVVTKHHWGAFYATDLDLQLRRRGVTGVVLAGISTSIGVESTAREAHDRAYNVTVAADATTDLHLPSHEHSLSVLFPRLAEVGRVDEIVSLLPQPVLQP